MTKQRKQIIINEITFWKKNKLLPEHYCDFLMTLYTEGEHENTELKGIASKSVKAVEKRRINFKYILLPIVAIALIVALYTIPTTWLLLLPTALLGISCIIAAVYYLRKNAVLVPILQFTAALSILFASIKVCLQYYPGEDLPLYIALIGNCVLWLCSGIFMKLTYFTIAGILGILAIIVYSSL